MPNYFSLQMYKNSEPNKSKFDVNFICLSCFVEYTFARTPRQYCNNEQSPPEKSVFLNKHGVWEETDYIPPPPSQPPPSSASQTIHFNLNRP